MDTVYAVIQDNRVVNLILASASDLPSGESLLEALPSTAIGDILVDGKLPIPRRPTLADAQEAKLAVIDRETEQAILSGFDHTVRGTSYHFSYDRDDQINFSEANGAAILAVATNDANYGISWRGWIGDTPHIISLNTQEYLTLARAAGDHKTACLTAGWQRQEAVRQAQTIKELENM